MATVIIVDDNSSNLRSTYKATKPREKLIKKGYNNLISEIFRRCPSELVALIFIRGSQQKLISALTTNKEELIASIEKIGQNVAEEQIEKCDVARLFTYLTTNVLHNISAPTPKKIIFFTDPNSVVNYRHGLNVLDHSYHVHMLQFMNHKREDHVIEEARRLCGTTAGGFYLQRANKDGSRSVREAINSICMAEYKEFKAQLIFGHLSTPITLLPNPHHIWKQISENSLAKNGQPSHSFLPDAISVLGFVQSSHFKSLPELCRFVVSPYALIYQKGQNVEIDPLCLMLNDVLKSNAMFALLSLGSNWHALLMHHVEVKMVVEKFKTKKRKKRKVAKPEEKESEPDSEKSAEKEKAEITGVVNSSNLKIKFFTDKSQQQSAQSTEQPAVAEKEKIQEEPEFEEIEEEIEVEKNGLMLVVLPPGLNVEWLGDINNLVTVPTSETKSLPLKRGKKRSYDTFSKGSTKLPSISTDSLQGAIKKIFKLTKALPHKPELLLSECDKLQSLVPIYGFDDIKRGLITRLKKAKKKVEANSKPAIILESLISQLEQNKKGGCAECNQKIIEKTFEVPKCYACGTIYPLSYTHVAKALEEGRDDFNLDYLTHLHLQESCTTRKVYEKLIKSDSLRDFSVRMSRNAPTGATISVENCQWIGKVLASSTQLWHFGLDCVAEADGASYLGAGLGANTKIEELDIKLSSLYEAEQLGKGIGSNKTIKRLNISGSNVTSDMIVKLLQEMAPNTTVQDLKFESMPKTTGALLLGLQYCRSVKTLKLLNLNLTGGIEGAEGLANDNSIEAIDMIGCKSIEVVTAGLAHNNSVKTWIVHSTVVNENSAAHIASMLRSNASLTYIDLQAVDLTYPARSRPRPMQIGSGGFALISDALKVNKSLTRLDFGDNGIGVDGLNAFGEALKVNDTLKVVELPLNQFTGNILNFAEGLKVNRSVHTLKFRQCALNNEGVLALVEALKVNRSLTSVDIIRHNKLLGSTYNAFCQMLKTNSTLKEVAFGTDSYYDTRQAIQEHGSIEIASLAEVIVYNTSLRALEIYDGALESRNDINAVVKLCKALAGNDTLRAFKCSLNRACDQDLLPLMHEMFQQNFSLLQGLDSHYVALQQEVRKYLARNLLEQKPNQDKIVLVANIVRSREALDWCPLEIWLVIFAHIRLPGIGSLEPVAKSFLNHKK